MITKNLWPYAMRYANNVNNSIPAKGSVQSPLELFSSMTMKLPICQFYHFGCPMYVLDSNLQAKKRGGSKWRQWTRLGINLGFSPQHTKSVHLILSLQSGCISPQFHCTFDNNFETLEEYEFLDSQWQHKAHFITTRGMKPESKHAKGLPVAGTMNDIQPIINMNDDSTME